MGVILAKRLRGGDQIRFPSCRDVRLSDLCGMSRRETAIAILLLCAVIAGGVARLVRRGWAASPVEVKPAAPLQSVP